RREGRSGQDRGHQVRSGQGHQDDRPPGHHAPGDQGCRQEGSGEEGPLAQPGRAGQEATCPDSTENATPGRPLTWAPFACPGSYVDRFWSLSRIGTRALADLATDPTGAWPRVLTTAVLADQLSRDPVFDRALAEALASKRARARRTVTTRRAVVVQDALTTHAGTAHKTPTEPDAARARIKRVALLLAVAVVAIAVAGIAIHRYG